MKEPVKVSWQHLNYTLMIDTSKEERANNPNFKKKPL
jgi:hypothetical protein